MKIARNLAFVWLLLVVMWQPPGAAASLAAARDNNICSAQGCSCQGWGSGAAWEASCDETYGGNFPIDVRESCYSYCNTYYCGVSWVDGNNGTCMCAELLEGGGC
jgi:hypothetical protein